MFQSHLQVSDFRRSNSDFRRSTSDFRRSRHPTFVVYFGLILMAPAVLYSTRPDPHTVLRLVVVSTFPSSFLIDFTASGDVRSSGGGQCETVVLHGIPRSFSLFSVTFGPLRYSALMHCALPSALTGPFPGMQPKLSDLLPRDHFPVAPVPIYCSCIA